MLPELTIDYQQRPAKRSRGWLLFALGVTFLLSAGSLRSALERDLSVVEEARGGKPARHDKAMSGKASESTEVAEAEEVLRQLTTPWSALFSSIEHANSDEIALLSVQPDAQRQVVTIAGEGKDYQHVLAYVSRLKAEPALAAVFLASNEVKESDPQRPVVFTISARWRAAP